jgi:hypothetical protein
MRAKFVSQLFEKPGSGGAQPASTVVPPELPPEEVVPLDVVPLLAAPVVVPALPPVELELLEDGPPVLVPVPEALDPAAPVDPDDALPPVVLLAVLVCAPAPVLPLAPGGALMACSVGQPARKSAAIRTDFARGERG